MVNGAVGVDVKFEVGVKYVVASFRGVSDKMVPDVIVDVDVVREFVLVSVGLVAQKLILKRVVRS